MLAVLTLFVISMLKTSIIELKIGGASQTVAMNISAAESSIDNFLSLNSGRFAPNWLSALGAAGPVAGSMSYTAAAGAYGALGTSVTLAANQILCGAPKQIGVQIGTNSLQAVQFDVAAIAAGALGIGGATIVHQGVQTLAPSGSCP
jgi:hypothetical protein